MDYQTIVMILAGVLIVAVAICHYWDKYDAYKERKRQEDDKWGERSRDAYKQIDAIIKRQMKVDRARASIREDSQRTRRKPAFKRIITHEKRQNTSIAVEVFKALYKRKRMYKKAIEELNK